MSICRESSAHNHLLCAGLGFECIMVWETVFFLDEAEVEVSPQFTSHITGKWEAETYMQREPNT